MRILQSILQGVWSLLLLASVLLVPAAQAADTTAVGGLDLLRQVSDAWRAENFRGRFVYVRGNRMDSMQIVHAVFDGVEHERISHLDNSAVEIIRRGNDIICIHPDARITKLDAADASGPFRQFAALDENFSNFYVVSNAGESRVAGRSASLLNIVARDPHRFGYRLWLDRGSRLPLRYEVVNRRGGVLESVEFVDLETGITVPKELFMLPSGTDARTLSRILTIVTTNQAPMPVVAPAWLPAGFRATGSQTQRQGEAGAPMSAVTYSDGLATFSLFVEEAGADAKPMGRQVGPTVVVSGVLDAAGAGRFRVTLVGEVPAGTAVKIVNSARHRVP